MAIDPGTSRSVGKFVGVRNEQGRYPSKAPAPAHTQSDSQALSWEAPEGLGDNKLLIIRTNGTHNFGGSPDYSLSVYEDFRGYADGDDYNPTHLPNFQNDISKVYETGSIISGNGSAYGPGYSKQRIDLIFDDPDALNGKKFFREMFVTWSLRCPDDIALGGVGNMKPGWVMLGDRGDNFGYPPPEGKEGHDIYIMGTPGNTNGHLVINGNNGSEQAKPDGGWTMGEVNIDQWHCKMNPEDPWGTPLQCYSARTAIGRGTNQTSEIMGTPLDTATSRREAYESFGADAWDRMKWPAWFRNHTQPEQHGQTVFSSDYYACMGENSLAHVRLTDAENVTDCQRSIIARPISWSPTEIRVRLNQGNLANLNQGYLHIRTGTNQLIVLPLGETN